MTGVLSDRANDGASPLVIAAAGASAPGELQTAKAVSPSDLKRNTDLVAVRHVIARKT